MPRVVPSQVVAVIDQLFPAAATQVELKEFMLTIGNASQLMGLLDLIERIPDELIVLNPEDYSIFTICTRAIRTQVEMWQSRGDTSFGKVPGLPPLNPVTLIRRCLLKCPDEAPSPGTEELSFITDEALRESIRLDISAANRNLSGGEWKGSTVLAGSAAEALLLWALQEHENRYPSSLSAAGSRCVAAGRLSRPPDPDPERWYFPEYIEVASKLQIVQPETADQLRQAKDFRNLIHPGRSKRLGQKCDRGTALAALAAVEFVVRDLTP